MNNDEIVSLFWQGYTVVGLINYYMTECNSHTKVRIKKKEAQAVVEQAIYDDYMKRYQKSADTAT